MTTMNTEDTTNLRHQQSLQVFDRQVRQQVVQADKSHNRFLHTSRHEPQGRMRTNDAHSRGQEVHRRHRQLLRLLKRFMASQLLHKALDKPQSILAHHHNSLGRPSISSLCNLEAGQTSLPINEDHLKVVYLKMPLRPNSRHSISSLVNLEAGPMSITKTVVRLKVAHRPILAGHDRPAMAIALSL
ncbi:MAG: hypothetical protein ACRYGG_17850 [Janthinobacterium lividum]